MFKVWVSNWDFFPILIVLIAVTPPVVFHVPASNSQVINCIKSSIFSHFEELGHLEKCKFVHLLFINLLELKVIFITSIFIIIPYWDFACINAPSLKNLLQNSFGQGCYSWGKQDKQLKFSHLHKLNYVSLWCKDW